MKHSIQQNLKLNFKCFQLRDAVNIDLSTRGHIASFWRSSWLSCIRNSLACQLCLFFIFATGPGFRAWWHDCWVSIWAIERIQTKWGLGFKAFSMCSVNYCCFSIVTRPSILLQFNTLILLLICRLHWCDFN